MAFVEITEVGEDVWDARGETLQGFGPELEIAILWPLDMVEAREIARAHPTNVSKVGGQVFDEAPLLRVREPLAFDEGERDMVPVQQFDHVVLQPTVVAKLDAEAYVSR